MTTLTLPIDRDRPAKPFVLRLSGTIDGVQLVDGDYLVMRTTNAFADSDGSFEMVGELAGMARPAEWRIEA